MKENFDGNELSFYEAITYNHSQSTYLYDHSSKSEMQRNINDINPIYV